MKDFLKRIKALPYLKEKKKTKMKLCISLLNPSKERVFVYIIFSEALTIREQAKKNVFRMSPPFTSLDLEPRRYRPSGEDLPKKEGDIEQTLNVREGASKKEKESKTSFYEASLHQRGAQLKQPSMDFETPLSVISCAREDFIADLCSRIESNYSFFGLPGKTP